MDFGASVSRRCAVKMSPSILNSIVIYLPIPDRGDISISMENLGEKKREVLGI